MVESNAPMSHRGNCRYGEQRFKGSPRERFSIKVALGDESIPKNFVL